MRSPFDQTFNINTINIHTVEGASCVNIGYNFPTGFESYKKHTQGFGSISGDNNQIDGLKSLLNDHSLVDAFSGTDWQDSPWMKELMASKLQDFLDSEDFMEDPFEDEEDEEEDKQSGHPKHTEQAFFINRMKEAYNDVEDAEDPYDLLQDLYEDEE